MRCTTGTTLGLLDRLIATDGAAALLKTGNRKGAERQPAQLSVSDILPYLPSGSTALLRSKFPLRENIVHQSHIIRHQRLLSGEMKIFVMKCE